MLSASAFRSVDSIDHTTMATIPSAPALRAVDSIDHTTMATIQVNLHSGQLTP